ncbi:hypothetical protein MASR2M41_11360 [Flammeovirgaceae bacterium]
MQLLGSQNDMATIRLPDRHPNEAAIKKLVDDYNPSSATIAFWENLQPLFNDFDKTKTVKSFLVDSHGKYH